MADRSDYDRGFGAERERARGYGDEYSRERSRERDEDRRRRRDDVRDEGDWRRGSSPDDYGRTRGHGGPYGTERGYAAGEDISRSGTYSPGRSRTYSGSEWSSRDEGDQGRSRERWPSRSRGRDDRSSSGVVEFTPVGYSYTLFAWTEPGPFSGRGPRGYQRSDERIREDICDRLTRHDRLDATDITVSVRNGEVTLEGIVDTREAKRMAEDVAESVDGVRDVNNHLKTYRGGSGDLSGRKTGSEGSMSASNVSGPANVPSSGGDKSR